MPDCNSDWLLRKYALQRVKAQYRATWLLSETGVWENYTVPQREGQHTYHNVKVASRREAEASGI